MRGFSLKLLLSQCYKHKWNYLHHITVNGSPRSDEAHQESEKIKIYCDGSIITSDTPIERYGKN